MYENRRSITACAKRRKIRRQRAQVRLILMGLIAAGIFLIDVGRAMEAASHTSANNAATGRMQGGAGIKQRQTGTQTTPQGDSKAEEQTTTRADSEASEAASAGDWNLILVNAWNLLPDGYDVSLTQLKNGHAVDTRCYPDLQDMMDDCRAAGLSPLICSSYRSPEKQERLYQEKVGTFLARGYAKEEARAEAGKVVAVPGTSEHQLGLAVDIVDTANQHLDESQETTDVQKWLLQNSWKYGFILRYPSDKSDITGIIYEPWHYRYVGKDAAKAIYEEGICLEEYVARLAERS